MAVASNRAAHASGGLSSIPGKDRIYLFIYLFLVCRIYNENSLPLHWVARGALIFQPLKKNLLADTSNGTDENLYFYTTLH